MLAISEAAQTLKYFQLLFFSYIHANSTVIKYCSDKYVLSGN